MMASISLDQVLKVSKYDQEDILNVFIVGSRAWGTAEPGSDWDLFVVLRDLAEPKSTRQIVDENDINLLIFSESEWRKFLIEDHNLQGIACLYLPTELILLNKFDWRPVFRLDEKRLKLSALRKASSSFNRARIYCKYQEHIRLSTPLEVKLNQDDMKDLEGLDIFGILRKSKKMILHCFRTVLFALQLFQSGQITHLDCATDIWNELKSDTALDWNYYEEKYHQKWHNLVAQFPEKCAELFDDVKANIPEIYHRLYKITKLPSLQDSYTTSILKEMAVISRKMNFQFEMIKQDVQNHFPSFVKYMEQTENDIKQMENLLQKQYDTLIKAVNETVQTSTLKIGEVLATKGRSDYPETFSLIHGMFKLNQPSAHEYLKTCPLTQFERLQAIITAEQKTENT